MGAETRVGRPSATRSRPAGQAPSGLVASRFDRAQEEWIPALVAFYRRDCSFMRAEALEKGWFGLDGTDLRTIEAIKAAIEVAP